MSRTLFALVALFLSASVLAADPAMQAQYSGLMTFETSAGVMKGPVATMPGMQRREFDMNSEPVVMISRHDKGVSWMLMPGQKMYQENKLDTGSDSPQGGLDGYDMKFSDEGRETVNGVSATKSKVVMTSKDGTKFGGFAWRTDDGIVVKLDALAIEGEHKQRVKMDLTDLEIGPQDPALFEIPAGYSALDMGGMMMRGMTGMGEDAGAEGGDESQEGDGDAAPQPKKKWGLKDAMGILKK